MPDFSALELLVVAAVALIVLGPEKLPRYARTAGRWINEMRRMAADVRREFESGLDDDDERVADEKPADAHFKDVYEGDATAPPSNGAVEPDALTVDEGSVERKPSPED